MAIVRNLLAALALISATGLARAAEPPVSRSQIVKRAKAATAFLQFGKTTATAFCVHSSGLFLTNEGSVPWHEELGVSTMPVLFMDANLKTQKVLRARVVRRDKKLDLALLEVEHQLAPLPTLALGDEGGLEDLKELFAFGFPFGRALDKESPVPAISVNRGRVTALPRDTNGVLQRIQLDAELNPGNTGGPVVDETGRVVGLVAGGVRATGINYALPVGHLKRFLARPGIALTVPVLPKSMATEPVECRAQLIDMLASAAPYEVELLIGPPRRERRFTMKPDKNAYRATIVPFVANEGPRMLRVQVNYASGAVGGDVGDRELRLGSEAVMLSQIRDVIFGKEALATLRDGRKIAGALGGAQTLAVQVGPGPHSIDVTLTGAAKMTLEQPEPLDVVSFTLVARQGGQEMIARSIPIYLEGALQKDLDATRDGHFSRPPRATSPITYFRAYSLGQDPIGLGKTYSYGIDEFICNRWVLGFLINAGDIELSFGGPGSDFLEVGEYRHARPAPRDSTSPTMKISRVRESIDPVEAQFAVWEFELKDGNTVIRLAIDFSFRSDAKSTFYGKIRLNSNFH